MEHLVGKLFEKKGYKVRVTQKTGDFGIDVEAKNSTEFIGIQVKHWNKDVGFDDCAKTLGVSHQYNKAIIISTKSGFTPQSWKFQDENRYRLELWNSARFKKELLMNGLSVLPNTIPDHIRPISNLGVHKELSITKDQKPTKKWWAGMTLLLILGIMGLLLVS